MALDINYEALENLMNGASGALSDDALAGVTGGASVGPGDIYFGHCSCGSELRLSNLVINFPNEFYGKCPGCGEVTDFLSATNNKKTS
jgi:hypothetical protein